MQDPASVTTRERLRRRILFVAGCVFLGLGAIGVFVPILPTTPFLLLAAACFLQSSPRAHRWLLSSRFLGGYIQHYQEGAGVPLRTKITAIGALWLTIGYSVVFVVEHLWLRALLLVIAVAVTVHLVSIRPRSR